MAAAGTRLQVPAAAHSLAYFMRGYFTFIGRNWPLLLFGFLCVFWGNFGQSFFLGGYGSAIKQDLGMSAQAYGATYSAATLASGFTMMWAGALIDRWRLRNYLLAVSSGLLAASLLMSQAHHWVVLTLAFFGIRLFGQGLLPHTGITTMARYFTADRGKAVSLAASGVPLGEILLPMLAVFLIYQLGWQGSWYVIALSVPLLLIPAALLLLRRAAWADRLTVAPAEPNPGRRKLSARRTLFRDRRFWLAAPVLLASPFTLTAVFIHQDFVLEQKQWAAAVFASSFVLYGLVHWASSILFGVLVDRYSGVGLLRVYVIPLLLALFAVANLHGLWVAPLMLALLGVTQGASGVVVTALWAEVYGSEIIGGVRAAVGAVMVLSTAVSPYLLGLLIDAGAGLTQIFNGFGIVFALALLLLRFSYRSSVS